MCGGDVSLTAFIKRSLESDQLLNDLYGSALAELIRTDRQRLRLILPVLHSNGEDLEAVNRLRDSFEV